MFGFRKKRIAELLAKGFGRPIRIHSVVPVPEGSASPKFVRVAFEFLDPPGPWSMQFYEASTAQRELLGELAAGVSAKFFESEDGARTRVLVLEDGRALMPR